MSHLPTLLFIAGLLHFTLLSASALVPVVLDWRQSLAPLAPLLRHLIWTHGVFIVFIIIGFGLISILNPRELASGSPLARSVCGFIAFFWCARLVLQYTLFEARPFLRGRPLLTLGYHVLSVTFLYFTVVYAIAALRPMSDVTPTLLNSQTSSAAKEHGAAGPQRGSISHRWGTDAHR